jgi:hypothetical protein
MARNLAQLCEDAFSFHAQMAYYIDLFSPETHQAFSTSSRSVSGFRYRQRGVATRIKVGDTFVCYVTRLSRWCGLLDVVDGPYTDDSPIFTQAPDPFVIRFHVRPRVWLPFESSVPIHDDRVWHALTFTKGLARGSTAWTGKVRGSLVQLNESDGVTLDRILSSQAADPVIYPLDDADTSSLKVHTVNRADKTVSVSVPEDAEPAPLETPSEPTTRESARVQSLIAQAGHKMGFSIWIPAADRGLVLREWAGEPPRLLERLPLNYDDVTLKTIEQIDVIWLRGRSIVRAFEVEHTTSVYSGILRMADLLALQPNMDIKLHIVAPIERREKVFSEIRRPVFSLLDRGPLAESCTYISYESVRELSSEKLLAHMSDSVLEEFSEEAE